MQYRNKRRDIMESTWKFVLEITHAPKWLSFTSLNIERVRDISQKHERLKRPVGVSLNTLEHLQNSQVIIFAQEQARVFWDIGKVYTGCLDYKLPFGDVFVQFSEGLSISAQGEDIQLQGLVLGQNYINEDERSHFVIFDSTNPDFEEIALDDIKGDLYHNVAYAIGLKSNGRYVIYDNHWFSAQETFLEYGTDSLRSLAIACIGYINCENIYLHREGEVSDRVNRKRAREGKKILEPYYVCRIRGVQYDSNGEPTGEGTHHGFRYDVRGHFRRLESGRTTWVRPHQRGLQHELYIPKTYVIEKGAKHPALVAAESESA